VFFGVVFPVFWEKELFLDNDIEIDSRKNNPNTDPNELDQGEGRIRRKTLPKVAKSRRVKILRIPRMPPLTSQTRKNTQKTLAMASQTRSSKRNIELVESESPNILQMRTG
jgi:hypothetical protein